MIETWAFGDRASHSSPVARCPSIGRSTTFRSILAIETGQTRLITVLEGGFCADLGLSPDGQTLVVKTPSEEYLLIAPGDGRVRSTIRLDDANGEVAASPSTPAGKWVVLGGRDMLSFRQLADGRVVGTLHALPPLAFDLPVHFWSVTLSRDGRFVAAVCSDFSVRVWHR
ncbi:MAG: hypothetical protein U0841_21655 [Chloroflexia bacterium]